MALFAKYRLVETRIVSWNQHCTQDCWLRLSGFGLLGTAWELSARSMQASVFPPLTHVIPTLWHLVVSGVAWQHISASIQHTSIGFCFAALIGCLLGIGMTQSRIINAIVMPLVDAVRPVAALTIFPLLILMLGLGLWSKAFVIFWTAWPAILLSTIHSIRQVDNSVIEAARLDGGAQWDILWHIILPLLPALVW